MGGNSAGTAALASHAGYSIAVFFGPRLAASIGAKNNGDFSKAFYIAIVVCLAGIAMSVVLTTSL
jgi:OFA family oxalate/formate antiporter-like MFS transporter